MFPVSLRSLGSPSSNSSVHNITEEEGHGDIQIQGKVDGHFTRLRHQSSKHSKGSSLSSNTPSNMSSAGSIASAGLVVWDMVRETLGRTRRPHSKDKNSSHHADDGKRSICTTSSSPTASANDREAAAIAILENVIDHFNPLPPSSNNSDAPSGSGSHKVRHFVFS